MKNTKEKINEVLKTLVEKTEAEQLHWELYIKEKTTLEENIVFRSRISYDYLATITYYASFSKVDNSEPEDMKWWLEIYKRKPKKTWTKYIDSFPNFRNNILTAGKSYSEETKEYLDKLIRLATIQTETKALKNEDLIEQLSTIPI